MRCLRAHRQPIGALMIALMTFWQFAQPLHAATVYWDVNSTTAGAGGAGGATPSGTWDGSNTFWSTTSDGTGATSVWTSGDTAVFAAGADATGSYTVTVSGTQNIGGLTFEEGAITLNGGTLNWSTPGTINVASGITTTINSNMTGSVALTRSGSGTLILGGTNSGYSGTVSLGGGVTRMLTSSALGTNTITLVNTDTVLELADGVELTNNITISNTGNAKTIRAVTGSVVVSSVITQSETTVGNFRLEANSGATLTVNSNIGGVGLRTGGSGTKTLTGNNTYTGNTQILGGTTRFSSASNLGSTGTVASILIGTSSTAATLFYEGAGDTIADALSWNGTTGGATLNASGTGALVFSSTAAIVSGAGSKTVTLTGTNSDANTIAGSIQNNSGTFLTNVSKTGAGTWVLTGANTFNNTTINGHGGTLRVAGGGRIGTAALTVNAGTLDIAGTEDQVVSSLAMAGGAAGSSATIQLGAGRKLILGGNVTTSATNNNLTATIAGGSGALLDLGGAAITFTVANSTNALVDLLIDSNVTLQNGGIIKAGAGTWQILSSLASVTGPVEIQAGALNASLGSLNLFLNGGVYESSGTFNRSLGTGAGQVQWASGANGGFAAQGGALTVTLGDAIVWDSTANFVTGAGQMLFGSVSADDVVTLANNIDLNNTGGVLSRTVSVTDNAGSTADRAELSGVLSNSGSAGGLTKAGNGTLRLTGNNTFTGPVTLTTGTLQFTTVSNNGGAASSLGQGTDGISLGGGILSFVGGTNQSTNRAISLTAASTLDASGTAGATITYTGAISANSSQLTLAGAATGEGFITGGFTHADTGDDLLVTSGTWTISGTSITVGDDLKVNGVGTVLNLDTTGVLSYFTGSTSNFLYLGNGGVVNFGADDLASPTLSGMEGIVVGFETAGATTTLNTNGFDITAPRLDVGMIANGFEGDITGSGTITVTVTTAGSGLSLYRGSVAANLAGPGAFFKAGLGDVMLSGDNSGLTGTTRIDAGNLILDYTVSNADKLNALSALDMRGGIVTINGNASASTTQSVASTTLANGGASKMDVNSNGFATTLNLGDITRGVLANDGTIRFELPTSGAITTTAANNLATSMGILGGWATVTNGSGNTFFARNDVSGPPGNIAAANTTLQDAIGSWVAGDNVSDAAGYTGTLADCLSVNSLRFNANAASAVALPAGGVLNIATGGILMTSAAATGAHTIFGGVLISGTGELIITQDSAAQGLTVSSTITGATGITKTGDGTLTLSGMNNHTGIIDLQAGTLVASGGNAISDTSVITLANDRDNTLQITSNETIGRLSGGNDVSGLTVGNVDFGSTTLTLNQTGTSTFEGFFTGSGTLVKSGGSTLTYTGNNGAAFIGTLRIDQGQITLSGDSTQFSAVTAIVLNGTGSLRNLQDQTTARNRIMDSATVLLNNTILGTGLSLLNNDSAAITETMGALTLGAGHNVITPDSDGGAAGNITFASLAAVNNHATALVRGVGLGDSTVAERGQVIFTAAPGGLLVAVGGTGTPATQFAIFPYLVGQSTLTGLGNSFVRNTGTTNGLKPLTAAEYITNAAGYNALTGSALDNVRFDTNPGVALTGTATAINSLVLDGASAITLEGPASSLEITSGAILSAQGVANVIHTFTGLTTGGGRDYTIYVTTASGSLTIDSPLASLVPLVKSGAGTLILDNTGNDFTDVYFNQGAVQVNALTKLGDGALNFFGGTLKFGAAFDVSTKTVTFGTGGGTFDTNGLSFALANGIGNNGAGGFTKIGTGALTLNGAATYTGTTSINAGSIVMGVNQAIGTGDLIITDGEFLNMGVFNATVGSVTTLNSTTNPLQGTGTLTASGNVILHQGTVGATLAGTMNLIKQTTAVTLTLGAANTYTGFTQVQDGTLSIGSIANAGASSAIGAPTGENAAIRLGNAATTGVILYTGGAGSSNRDFWLTGTTGGGTIDNDGSGALVLSGKIQGIGAGAKLLTLQGTAGTLGTPNELSGMICELASVISLDKAEAGVWELSGANEYSGTSTLNAGTLLVGNNSAFGSGMLILNGGNLEDDGTSRTLANDLTINSAASIIGGASGLTFTGALTSVVGLKKGGTGTMTLSGATSSYTGTTEVWDGRLTLAGTVNDRLSTASSVVLGDSTTSGILQLGNASGASNQELVALSTTGIGTTSAVVGGNAAFSTLTVNQSSDTIFAGNIGGTGANENNLNLVKSGAGRLIVSGTVAGAAWTGTTSVNAGKLMMDSMEAFAANSTSLAVADGAEFSLRGTGLAANQVYGFGASAGNKVTLGTGSGTAVLGFRVDGAYNTQLQLLTGQTMTVAAGTIFQTAVYVDDAPTAVSYILIAGADAGSLHAGGGTFDFNPVIFNGGSFTYALTNETGGGTFDRWVLTPTAEPAAADVWWKGDLGGIATGVWSAALVGPDTNWDDSQAGNVDAQVPPDSGSIVHFSANGAANFTTTLGSNMTIQELRFEIGGSDISVGGISTLTIGNTVDSAGITMVAGAPANVSFSANVALAQAQSINIADSGDTLIFTGGLSGIGALGINSNGSSTGTMVLGGSSGLAIYSGATNLVTGRLILQGGANERLPTVTALTMGNASLGAILQLGDSVNGASNNTVGTLNTGAATTNSIRGGFTSASILTVVQGSAGTFNGVIGGVGTNENQVGFTKQGTATLILNGANTYTGATTINDGVLQLGSSGSINGTTALTINANAGVVAEFDVNGRTAVLGGAITLGGANTTAQADIIDTTTGGLITLGGNIVYDATNNPLGSTMDANLGSGGASRIITVGDSSSTTNELTLNGTYVGTTNHSLTFDGDGSGTVNGNISILSGSGTTKDVNFNSTGTWNLNAKIEITDTISINSGVINATAGESLDATSDVIIDGTGVQDSAIVNISSVSQVHTGDDFFIRNGGRVNVSVTGGIGTGTDALTIGDSASIGAAAAGRLHLASADISPTSLAVGAVGGQIGNITGTGSIITTGTKTLRNGTIESGVTLAGAGAITKNSNGTLTFSGTRDASVGATNIQEGHLILDYSTNNASKIGGVLTLGAAQGNLTAPISLTLNGNAAGTTQSVTSTAISNTGDTVVDINDSGVAATLALGAITRSVVGSTVSFDYSALGMATATDPANIALGWATVATGGTTRIGAINGSGNIVQATTITQNNVSQWGSLQNVINSAAYSGSLDPDCNTIASLTFDAAGASTVTIGTGSLLIITSGGILVNSSVGANASVITGGSILGATGTPFGELIVHQNNAAGSLTINSDIINSSGVTKSGLGMLVLGGTNSFLTGSRLTINEGTVQLSGGNAIGDATLVIMRSGTTLDLNNTDETIGNLGEGTTNLTAGTIDLGSGALTINQTAASTFAGNFLGNGMVLKSGGSTLTFTGTSTMTGTLLIDQGQILLNGNNANFTGVTAIILNGTGSLRNEQTNNVLGDRIKDTAAITLNNTIAGEGLWFFNSDDGNRSETVGALTLGAGHNVITAESTNSGAFTGSWIFASLSVVNNHATSLVRGTALGSGTDDGRIRFTAAPSGGVGTTAGGAIGTTKNLIILPYLVGDVSASGLGNSFVTNTGSTNGLRPLAAAEYDLNTVTLTAGNNTRYTATTEITTLAAINSLVLDSGTAINLTANPIGSIEITSGAILAAGVGNHSIGTISAITTGGSRDYTIYVTTAASTLTLSSSLTSAVSLVKSGAGTLSLTAAGTGNAFTDIYLNQGAVIADDLDRLGTGVLRFFGGGVRLAAGFADDLSTKTWDINTGGGTLDVSLVTANSGVVTLANGIDDATASSGETLTVITRSSGTAGQLVIQGSSSFTGTIIFNHTLVTNGTTNSIVLNGTTNAAINGNIQLGSTTLPTANEDVTLALGADEQIVDTASITFLSSSGEEAYFKLLGRTETVAGISAASRGVIENFESATDQVAGNGKLIVNSSQDFSYRGFMRDRASGAGGTLAFEKQGTGTQTLSGASITYTGPTTITGGTLQLTDTTAFASDITNNAALTLNGTTGTWTLSKVISGSGTVTKLGAGAVTLSGGSSYSGVTNIEQGMLSISASDNLGDASATNDIRLANNATLQSTGASVDLTANRSIIFGGIGGTIEVTDTNTLTTPGALIGEECHILTKTGTGLLVITNATNGTSFDGGLTNVSAGILQVGAAGAGQSGSGTVTVASGATLAGSGTINGSTIIGGGAVLQAGDVTTVGTAATTVTGNGSLILTAASSTALTVENGGQLRIGISNTTTHLSTGVTDLLTAGTYTSALDYITANGTEFTNDWNVAPGSASDMDYINLTGAGSNVSIGTRASGTFGNGSILVSGITSAQLGQVFNLLDWQAVASMGGTFTTGGFSIYDATSNVMAGDLDLAGLGAGLAWDVSAFKTYGIVVVVPEPSRAFFIMLGLLGLLMRRRRRVL